MEKNQELRNAWDFVEHTGISIFLTGKAGTGKTTFLRTLKERSNKRCGRYDDSLFLPVAPLAFRTQY